MQESNSPVSVWTVVATATPVAVVLGLNVWYLSEYGARVTALEIAVAKLQTTVEDNFKHPDGVFDSRVSGLTAEVGALKATSDNAAKQVADMKRITDLTDENLKSLIEALGKQKR